MDSLYISSIRERGGGGGSDCSKSKFAESLINKSSNSSSRLSVNVCLLLDACM